MRNNKEILVFWNTHTPPPPDLPTPTPDTRCPTLNAHGNHRGLGLGKVHRDARRPFRGVRSLSPRPSRNPWFRNRNAMGHPHVYTLYNNAELESDGLAGHPHPEDAPKPPSRNPKPKTLTPKPHKPEKITLNIWNPKTQPLNPKPQALNPKNLEP